MTLRVSDPAVDWVYRAPKDWSGRESDGALELGLTRKRARRIKHERCSSNGADKAAAK